MAIQAQRFFGDRESLMRKGSASDRQKEFRDRTMQAAQLDEQRRQEAQRRMDLQQAYLREDLKELHGFDIGVAGGGELSNGLNMLAQDASRRMREANNPIEAQEILAGFKSQYNAMKQRNEMAKDTIDQYNNAFNGSNLPKANGQQAVQPEASQVMESRNAWNNPFQGAEMQVVNGQLMVQGENGQMISVTEDPRFINTDMWNLDMQPIDSGNLDDWAKSPEVLGNIALDFPVYDDANREAIQQRAGQIYDEGLMLQNDTGYAHRDQILNYLEAQKGGAPVLSAEDRQRWLNGDIRNENGEIDSAFVPVINAGKRAFQERATWTGQFSAGKGGGGSKSGGAKTGDAREGYTGATSTRVVRSTPMGPVQGEVQSLEQEGPEQITINGIDPIDMSGVLEGGQGLTITGWGVDHNGELTITTEQKIGLMEVKDPDTGATTYRPAGPNEQPDIETTKSVDISGSERASLTPEQIVILESADETLQNLGYGEDITIQATQARSNWDASQRAAQQAATDAAIVQDEVNRVTTVDQATGQNVDPQAVTYGPQDGETRGPVTTTPEQEERFKSEEEDKGASVSLQVLENQLEDWEKDLRGQPNSGLAVLTKNLGNLKSEDNPHQNGTVSTKDGNYAVFDNYEEGLLGLIFDIKSKQHKDGHSSRWVRPGASTLEALKIYAPAEDKNDPEGYAKFIVDSINERIGSNFSIEDDFSSLPTELLVEFIVKKEDAGLYGELKERGFFDPEEMAVATNAVSRN